MSKKRWFLLGLLLLLFVYFLQTIGNVPDISEKEIFYQYVFKITKYYMSGRYPTHTYISVSSFIPYLVIFLYTFILSSTVISHIKKSKYDKKSIIIAAISLVSLIVIIVSTLQFKHKVLIPPFTLHYYPWYYRYIELLQNAFIIIVIVSLLTEITIIFKSIKNRNWHLLMSIGRIIFISIGYMSLSVTIHEIIFYITLALMLVLLFYYFFDGSDEDIL